jgi:hypothetical protein
MWVFGDIIRTGLMQQARHRFPRLVRYFRFFDGWLVVRLCDDLTRGEVSDRLDHQTQRFREYACDVTTVSRGEVACVVEFRASNKVTERPTSFRI